MTVKTIKMNPDVRVLLIGDTGGIGAALRDAFEGATLTCLSRSRDGLDITDEASVRAAAERVEGPFNLIFDATGALQVGDDAPEKSIAQIDPEAMARQFRLNAIGPALLLKHFSPMMATEGLSVFATLSARVGSIGDNRIGGWISYRASKAALNQIVRTAAIEIGRRNRNAIVVALHPGTVRTPLSERYVGRHKAVEPPEAAAKLFRVLHDLRPEHSGGFYDYAFEPIEW